MSWRQNTRTMTIDPGEIDFSDKTYYLPCYEDIDGLVESVREVGLLNSPLVKKNGQGRLIVVLGRRRLRASVRAQMRELQVLEIDSRVAEETLINLVFWDNLFRIRNNLVSTAVMTSRLLKVFELGIVAERYLPWMGAPSRGPKIERLKSIANLDERSLKALWSGKISEKTATLLTRLTVDERSIMLEFINYFGWNSNKAAEVLQSVYDVSILAGESTSETISKATELTEKQYSGADIIQKANVIRNLIRAWKSTDLAEEEVSFDQWLETLKLPKHIQIRHAQSFESQVLTIETRANSRKDAEQVIEQLTIIK